MTATRTIRTYGARNHTPDLDQMARDGAEAIRRFSAQVRADVSGAAQAPRGTGFTFTLTIWTDDSAQIVVTNPYGGKEHRPLQTADDAETAMLEDMERYAAATFTVNDKRVA
jgi:hypothetical protein